MNITDKYLNITHQDDFLTENDTKYLFNRFDEKFKEVKRNNDGTIKKLRSTLLYGEPGLIYQTKYGGYKDVPETISQREVTSWDEEPALVKLKDMLFEITGDKYNVCAIQYYPNGRTGINPHKDKEMIAGTTICGISLGETRNLIMIPPKFLGVEKKVITLNPGSIYMLHPPTNDYWMHSIEKDKTTGPRISLTFRNYIAEK